MTQLQSADPKGITSSLGEHFTAGCTPLLIPQPFARPVMPLTHGWAGALTLASTTPFRNSDLLFKSKGLLEVYHHNYRAATACSCFLSLHPRAELLSALPWMFGFVSFFSCLFCFPSQFFTIFFLKWCIL